MPISLSWQGLIVEVGVQQLIGKNKKASGFCRMLEIFGGDERI